MKKKCIMLLVLGLLLLATTGCGMEAYFNKQNNATGTEEKELPKMELNEPFLVTTVTGDYSLTINGARITPQRNEKLTTNPKQVVFLDYTYANISYEKRSNIDFFLAQGDFVVSDGDGNRLVAYDLKDPNRMIKESPIGDTCSASIAYGLETDSNDLTVTFVRGKGREIAQITIPIK